MAFKCNNCRKITYDIDSPPCGESNCLTFHPIKVIITHFVYKNKIVCTGEVASSMVRSNHLLMVVNCPRCRAKSNEVLDDIRSNEARLNRVAPTSKVEPEKPSKVYLADLELPAKIIDALFQYSMSIENMSLMTLVGYSEWLKDNSNTTIPGLTEDDQIQLLSTINKV